MVKRTVWPPRAEVDVSVPFPVLKFVSVFVIEASRIFGVSVGVAGGTYRGVRSEIQISPYPFPLLFSTTARK